MLHAASTAIRRSADLTCGVFTPPSRWSSAVNSSGTTVSDHVPERRERHRAAGKDCPDLGVRFRSVLPTQPRGCAADPAGRRCSVRDRGSLWQLAVRRRDDPADPAVAGADVLGAPPRRVRRRRPDRLRFRGEEPARRTRRQPQHRRGDRDHTGGPGAWCSALWVTSAAVIGAILAAEAAFFYASVASIIGDVTGAAALAYWEGVAAAEAVAPRRSPRRRTARSRA